MAETTLKIQPRELGGSPAARAIRRRGAVPGILYGRGREPYPFQIDVPSLREALTGDAGRHTILQVSVPGESRPTPALLKDYQLDPVRDRLTHIDLLAISMTEKITAPVSLNFVGDAPGVTIDGGVFDADVHEVEVTALPGDLPDAIEVDISNLHVGETVRLADVPVPPGVEWATDPDTVLASIARPTTVEEPEAEEAEAEAAEAAEAPAADEESSGE